MEPGAVRLGVVLGAGLASIVPLCLYLWHRRLSPNRTVIDARGLGGAMLVWMGLSMTVVPFTVFNLAGDEARWDHLYRVALVLVFLAFVASPLLLLVMVATLVFELMDRKRSAAWKATGTALCAWTLAALVACTVGIDEGYWPSA